MKLREIISKAKVIKCKDKDLPVLSITLRDGFVLQSSHFKKEIASKDKSNYNVVKKNQLVQSIHIDEGGFSVQYIVDEGIVSPAYKIWDVDISQINPIYLNTFLRSKPSIAYYKSKLRGTIHRRGKIDDSDILGMEIPVPPLAEQERIVTELDLLQGIIDKQKAQLKDLDTLAQSIFCDMFQHEHGQVVKLHDVCSIVSGLVNPNEEPYCNYPHIGGANIESGTGVFINVKLAKEENLISGKYLFDETMILYSKIRPNLNKVALPSFVGICSADMYPIIPDRDRIDRTFLKFVLSQPDFLEYAISHSGRANIPKINREDLMDYSFMSYSLSLQQVFATKIEAIERQKASINASIAETQKLFDYTMDKYFG